MFLGLYKVTKLFSCKFSPKAISRLLRKSNFHFLNNQLPKYNSGVIGGLGEHFPLHFSEEIILYFVLIL